MGTVGPGDIINVLVTILDSAQGTAEVRTGIPVGKFLSGKGAVRRCLGERAVPEKMRLVYDVRRNRGYQANVEDVVMPNGRDEAAGIGVRAGLREDVFVVVTLNVVSHGEEIVGG